MGSLVFAKETYLRVRYLRRSTGPSGYYLFRVSAAPTIREGRSRVLPFLTVGLQTCPSWSWSQDARRRSGAERRWFAADSWSPYIHSRSRTTSETQSGPTCAFAERNQSPKQNRAKNSTQAAAAIHACVCIYFPSRIHQSPPQPDSSVCEQSQTLRRPELPEPPPPSR